MLRRLIELPVFVLFLTATLSTISLAEEESYWSWLFTMESRKGVAPVTNETYLEKCGACHFAYQPGLLPKASWEMLLARDAVANHFDRRLKLDEAVRLEILELLRAHSADSSRYKRSKKIMASLSDGSVPIRITHIPYIKKKHHAVIENVAEKSDRVFSLNHCDDCHQKARKGIFDDDTVFIQGYGYYDD